LKKKYFIIIVNLLLFGLNPVLSQGVTTSSAEASGISRGGLNGPDFFLETIRVLKGYDAVITWQNSKIDNQQYTINIYYPEFDSDTSITTKDTIITLSSKLLASCNPCELKMENTSGEYPMHLIYTGELTDNNKPIFDKLISDIDNTSETSKNQHDLIQLLISEGFISSAHSYYNKFLSSGNKDNPLSTEYLRFLEDYYNREPNKKDRSGGIYHAIIISENEYADPSITNLIEPENDALKFANVLINKYSFSKNDMIVLDDPTRNEIIDALDKKRKRLSKDDNLIIFYAGHGYWDEGLKMGYWLPSDAQKQNKGTWIANTDLTTYISAIQAKNVLLISDACFSGGIFKTRGMKEIENELKYIYELKSRKAITSGNLMEVPDQSVLMKFMTEKLENNNQQFISTDQLFATINQDILNNSNTDPLYGVIQMTGDEGGEFVFYNTSGTLKTNNKSNNELVEIITKKEKRSIKKVIDESNKVIDKPLRVAIIGFDNTGKVSEYGDMGGALRDMLTTDLQEVENLTMVDRQALEKVLNEQKLNNSKNFDATTSTKIGKLLGAEIILTGTYFEFYGSIRIDAKFINVETGEIIFSVGTDGTREKFFDLKKDLANKIVEKLRTQ